MKKINLKKTIPVVVLLGLFLYWVIPESQIPNPVDGCNSENYDHQTFWYPWGDHFHRGIDVFADSGTVVRSVVDGIVVKLHRADGGNKGGGNFVEVLGKATRAYYYAHMCEIAPDIKLWGFVRQGQPIGKVGKTGNANRDDCPPHCHFSIHTWIPELRNGRGEVKYRRWDRYEKFFYINPIIAMGDSTY